MKVNVTIERGRDGTYDACMEVRKELTFGLLGQGKTVKEAIEDFYITLEDMKKLYQDTKREFPENLEFAFYYDTASSLAYYPKHNFATELSQVHFA